MDGHGEDQDQKDRVFWAASTYPSEDFRIDAKDDSSKPINKIHTSPKAFRDQMVQIAAHAYARTTSRKWAAHLRFLEIQSSAKEERDSKALVLRDKADVTSHSYVAVSYCWDRSGAAWFSEQTPSKLSIFESSSSLREVSGSDVLCRAVKFAHHHGCENIWMDQYCIDQNDPVDKQDGIQAMDIVYQASQHPVAILESYVDTQEKVDALATLFTGEMIAMDHLEELEEVLEILVDDAWFTRAWTLQEAVSAGSSMRVLIGCPVEADKPEEFGSIPGEIETTIWDLQTAMVTARNWMEEFFAAGVLEDDGTATRISNYADELFNMLPDILPAASDTAWANDRARDPSDRQICNAAEAINTLQNRKNSVFSDRLGIVGNLCDYEIRLNSDVLEHMPFAFSTCVHTLAILNGDTSLLARYSDPHSRSYLARDGRNSVGFTSDPLDSAGVNYGFSWGPVPWGSLRNIEYFDQHDEPLKLAPATLTLKGLRVRGTLWSILSSVNLRELQAQFSREWEEELEAQRNATISIEDVDKRSTPLAEDFVSTLLQNLYQRGHHELTRTLWDFFQPRKEESIASRKSESLYSFEEIFGPRAVRNIASIKTGLRVQSLGIVPLVEGAQPTITRAMLDDVCSKGSLLFGAKHGSFEPRVYFESCKMGDCVFTPRTDLGDRICTESLYRSQAVSWRVSLVTHSEDGPEILHCHGRRRGIYRTDDLDVIEYYLE
ncbi:hypothetical protein MMC10_005966 [Thelotrema lepadinum]|nr:hypothetical protein [Thelotrema lepadinum]